MSIVQYILAFGFLFALILMMTDLLFDSLIGVSPLELLFEYLKKVFKKGKETK